MPCPGHGSHHGSSVRSEASGTRVSRSRPLMRRAPSVMASSAAKAWRMHHAASAGAMTNAAASRSAHRELARRSSRSSRMQSRASSVVVATACRHTASLRQPAGNTVAAWSVGNGAGLPAAGQACARRGRSRRSTGTRPNSRSPTSATGPTQSPHFTISVGNGARAATSPTSTARWSMAVCASTLPVASIDALMPFAVARICGSRVSMLRNPATARCSRAPTGWRVNQLSFDMPRIACAPSRAPSMASRGSVSSRQISGTTGISRPSARRSGNTRAPSPARHVPAHGNQRRSSGPSSHAGTYSVSGNGRALRYCPSNAPDASRKAALLYSPLASRS